MFDSMILAMALHMGAPAAKEPVIPVTRSASHPSMVGEHPSTYRGKYFTERSAAFWRCVRHRESRGHYFLKNPASSASGSMQWLDRSWRNGLAHMATYALRLEHGLTKAEAKNLKAQLRAVPITRWSRQVQDAAAFASMNWQGELSNARHWYYPGSPCNAIGGI